MKQFRNLDGVNRFIMAKAIKASRSAETGKFVKKSYAKKHPTTTVTETIKKGKKSS